MATLLIKNVRILGGEREYPDSTDIFVSGDKISAIGNFPTKGADQILDGQGAYLSPGFIDVNTDSDHYLSLFDHPEQEDFLRQGVTTIIGGMCGSSLAPLIYGTLESVRKWGDISKTNVDWHTMAEFLGTLDKRPLALNFATLVGHSTVRRAIIGEDIRDLTKNELAIMNEVMRKALEEGGFGISTGLGYVHSNKTPYTELKNLASIVKEYGGVYATHLRKSGVGIVESVEEVIRLAEEVGVKALISHFVPVLGFEKEYESSLAKIEKLPMHCDFHFDIYPSDTMVFPLYTFLPAWAQSGGLEAMVANLEDQWVQRRILNDISEIRSADFILAQAPGNEFLIGRSLKELSSIFNTPDYRKTLLKLMLTTRLRGIVFYKNINYSIMNKAILSPRALIASNAASYPYSGTILKPERAVSTFTKFLGIISGLKAMTLETAIRKITAEPARKFGLEKRGVIGEGNFADFAIFSIDKNTPHEGGRVEIKFTVVNGQLTMREGMFNGRFPGKILRHKT